MKKIKHKESHVAPTKYGMGDYYGSAIKNPIGRIREDYINNPVKGNTGKPPKSFA